MPSAPQRSCIKSAIRRSQTQGAYATRVQRVISIGSEDQPQVQSDLRARARRLSVHKAPTPKPPINSAPSGDSGPETTGTGDLALGVAFAASVKVAVGPGVEGMIMAALLCAS